MKTRIYLTISTALLVIAVGTLGQPITGRSANDKAVSVLPTNVVNLGDIELRFGSTTNAAVWEGTRIDDANPTISGDGLTLFYISTAPGGLGEHDIWMVTRSNLSSAWSSPINLGPTINSKDDEGEARPSYDGLSLYVTSNRPGGRGGYDLWVATRPSPSQPFAAPINLGSTVNGPSDDGACSISGDNRTLIFASSRSGGLGGFNDFWITTRSNVQASWEPATNMDAPISSENFEISPCLSPDGLQIFFMSDRGRTGPGSIWVARRASVDSPFGSPALIIPIADSFPYGADTSSMSADGTKLYFNIYRAPYPDWSALQEIDITILPQLKAEGKKATGEFQLELIGREGVSYEIQTSANLGAWATWLTTNTAGSAKLADPASVTEGRRFYRVLSH